MKIFLATAGSRGDVEPFIAFARYASGQGHTVLLALPDNSGADTTGVETFSLQADYSALIEDQGVSPMKALRSFTTVVRPIMRAVIVNSVIGAMAFQPDVILYHPKILSAPIAADHLGIPHIAVDLVPVMTPTRRFAAPGTTTANLGPFNRLTYAAVAASGRMFAAELNEARSVAGADSTGGSAPQATLVPVSPTILPRPQDWPDSVHLMGAWRSDAPSQQLSTEVESFTADPFLYAGFGSMALGDPEARGRALVEAARSRGKRLLVATGLGGIAIPRELQGSDVLEVTSVDHASILPRAIAAIHHGGIGTVHAVGAAGKTSIIVPFIADQPFWGSQLHRNGLAPKPIPHRGLTMTRLQSALDSVEQYDEKNRAVGKAMAKEDGLAAALKVVEKTR